VSGFSEDPPLALFDAVPSDEGWTTRPLAEPDLVTTPGGVEAPSPGIVDAASPGIVDAAEVTVTDDAAPGAAPVVGAGPTRPDFRAEDPDRPWRAGDDAVHAEHGHGWVQGSGHGRVTVRFETALTGPGPARTFDAADPALTRADPLLSWRPVPQ
jgi:DNA polymerase IV